MKLIGIVRFIILSLDILLLFGEAVGSPVPERQKKEILLVPVQMPGTRIAQGSLPVNMPPYLFQSYPHMQGGLNAQTKGPFSFIGQWIQQTPWLPLEVNVPDVFQNIGNGINQAGNTVSQLSQNVANGVTQFSQNVGNGFNQFSQNVGNGFTNWMQQLGQRVPIIANFVGPRIPVENSNIQQAQQQQQQQQVVVMVPIEFPAGQQLILANEALDAFP